MERMEPNQKSVEQMQPEAVQALINLHSAIKEVDPEVVEARSAKVGLSFIVDRKRLNYPEDWTDQVISFGNEAVSKYKKGGHVDLSWFLSNSVAQEYMTLLSELEQKAIGDDDMLRRLGVFKVLAKQSNDFYKQSHDKGDPVAITGVPKDFIPDWLNLDK